MTDNFNFLTRFFANDHVQDQILSSKLSKLTLNDVQKSLEVLSSIFDHLKVGIWIMDFQANHVSYISKGAQKILHMDPDQKTYPDMWEQMIHVDDYDKVLQSRQLLISGEIIEQKYRIYCGKGGVKWIYDQSVPLLNDQTEVTGMFRVFSDLTAEMEVQQQHKYRATHDLLTGLPNRRSLYEKIDHLLDHEQKNKFALLYLDLDRFTLINDSLGHHIGDLVLKEIATRLISLSSDNIHVFCLNNNDFIIVLENSPSKSFIVDFANNLTNIIGQVMIIEGYELYVTTSIGVSHYPSDGKEKVELIASAHTALNRAKQLGINNIEFHSLSKEISSYKKLSLEQDMRKAIENKEFELYFQPIVDPHSGVIDSAEALIRWNHNEWGLVSPGEFIPLAEENHFIIPITDWTIEEVCRNLYIWKNKDYPLKPISINISPIRFMKSGLVQLVKEQLMIHDLDPSYIRIEITENSLLRNNPQVLQTIKDLKKIGIRIALDDFGTGFASLQYLRAFPIDVIKIDQIFTQNIQSDNIHDAAIISSIIHLAKKLNLTVIAEGVEENEQLKFLQQNKCNLIQGYLFSKPVPIDVYLKMMRTGYIKPSSHPLTKKPKLERRKYNRLKIPTYVIGKISIIEVNKNQVNLGKANILIENISQGGLKILSALNLPINSAIKFKFFTTLVGEPFGLSGELIWKEEAKRNTFYYGVRFLINKSEQDQLAIAIRKIDALLHAKQKVLNTPLLYEDPYVFLGEK